MIVNLKLFDEFERTDAAPAKYRESLFDALNHLSWNNVTIIRATLEDWFSAYPQRNKNDLWGRFGTKNNSNQTQTKDCFEGFSPGYCTIPPPFIQP